MCSAATASAISPIEKNTKSVDGIGSTRAVAPQLPPADSRCRSIQALASPKRFAGAWSWCRLCAVCRTSDRSSPRSDRRCARRYSKLASAGVFVYRVIRQQTRAESGLEARRFRRHRRGCLGRQCVHAGLLPPLRCRGGKPEASAPSAPASGTGGASKSLSRGCPPTRAAAEGRGARGRRVRRRATSRRSAEAGRGCAGGRCARRWPGPAGCRRRGGCGCRRTPCG